MIDAWHFASDAGTQYNVVVTTLRGTTRIRAGQRANAKRRGETEYGWRMDRDGTPRHDDDLRARVGKKTNGPRLPSRKTVRCAQSTETRDPATIRNGLENVWITLRACDDNNIVIARLRRCYAAYRLQRFSPYFTSSRACAVVDRSDKAHYVISRLWIVTLTRRCSSTTAVMGRRDYGERTRRLWFVLRSYGFAFREK